MIGPSRRPSSISSSAVVGRYGPTGARIDRHGSSGHRVTLMSEPKPEPTRRLPRWLHISLVVFAWLFMFGWVNIPPYRGNILEEKHGFFVWKWQLYSRA